MISRKQAIANGVSPGGIDEACTSVDDVYGWVTRAFGRNEVAVNLVDMLVAVQLRKKTLRYGWPEVKYEACKSATEVIWVLWRVPAGRCALAPR